MNALKGKTVLVTGGTGSFGRYVVKMLLDTEVSSIRIFSRDEKKQFDMQHKFRSDPRISFMLGDVRDMRAVRGAVAGVDCIFHAAALKQVPHCERYPDEAIRTNIEGAQNLIDAALDEKVESMIAISTDKAVQPVNVMGMTKALQEKLMMCASTSKRNRGTRFVCVRYGNVLNSRGSVVPFFRAQLANNVPLTITSSEMTRFLLTLQQAVELVFYAYMNAKGGEIMVKKAPSAKVMDIARMVCELAGKEFTPRMIGIYPGEKLHEILVSEEERTRCVEREGYFLILPWEQKSACNVPSSEYSSKTELIGADEVRKLLVLADGEAEGMEFDGGYFTR